jgi:hypothetical protein
MYHVVDKVKASIGAGEIKIMAWNILGPKWAAHTDGYDLNVDDCTIHNKDWVEIVAIRSPDVNAIADRFYKPNPKSPNEPIFKTAKFLVNFCIPWAIYSAFLDRDTEQQEQSQSYDNTENSRSIESEDEDSVIFLHFLLHIHLSDSFSDCGSHADIRSRSQQLTPTFSAPFQPAFPPTFKLPSIAFTIIAATRI